MPPDDPELRTNSFREPLKRILREAGLTKFGEPPRNITSRLFPGDRGPVCQQIFLCTTPEDEIPDGEWHDVDNLPADIIGEHVSLIELAVQSIYEEWPLTGRKE